VAITNTKYHGLNKQDFGDTRWDTGLDQTIDQLDWKLILRDPIADRPSSPSENLIFYATDEQITYYWDGGQWVVVSMAPSQIDPADLGFDPATQTELDNHVNNTNNPHNLDASDFGAVENEGGAPSILEANRSARPGPGPGTQGRIFIATDTREVFRDTGTSWETIALAPGEIDPGELGFDPATQSELDSHANNTNNPHNVSGSDINAIENAGGFTSGQIGAKSSRPSAGSGDRIYIASDTKEIFYDNGSSWVRVAEAPSLITQGDLGFSPASLSDLLDVLSGGSSVSDDISDLNFNSSDFNVSDAGSGQVDVGLSASVGGSAADISEDGTLVVSEASDINFGNNVAVADDNDGTATVGVDTDPTFNSVTANTDIQSPSYKDGSGNTIASSVSISGQTTLSSGTAVVDTGISTTDATFQLALGVDDPGADTKITGRLFWDDSAGTYKIEFVEDGTSVGNPVVNYDVIRVR
jgi:hypothetical protein